MELLQTSGVEIAALLLICQSSEVQIVAAIAQGDTTRFVVSRDKNQRFFGVLTIKLVSHANGFVSINHLAHHRRSVVVVTSPVYLASFNHAEKLLRIFLLQESNRGARDVCQSQIALFAVECIRDRGIVARIIFFVLQENHAVGFAILFRKFLVTVGNGEALGASLVVEVSFAFVKGSRFQEVTPCKEVKVGSHEVTTDFCIHLAVLLVSIETGRSGVVHAHTGGDAHGCACFFRPYCNRSHGGDAVGEYANCVVVSFASSGKCRTTSCGIRDAVARTLRVYQSHMRKRRENQRFDTNAPFEGSSKGFGSIHLVDAHAVTNEIKHIFGCILRPSTRAKHHAKC